MTIEFIWRLPVAGDGRGSHSEDWNRGDYKSRHNHRNQFSRLGLERDGYTYYDLLLQIARAAEINGFNGLFIPQSNNGEEPQIVAGALARETKRINFIVSLPTALLSAVYSAKIANSFQRLSNGRLQWHLHHAPVHEPAWHGQSWSLTAQLERSDEFLQLTKGFWEKAPFSFEGKYFLVENGGFAKALQGPKHPLVYLDGLSDEAKSLSARRADIHILSAAPLDILAKQIADLRSHAERYGRQLKIFISAEIVARHSEASAWEELQQRYSDAQAKTVSLHTSTPLIQDQHFSALQSDERLWTGFDLLREGEAAGLVGSYEQVAERLLAYHQLGVSGFILGANPHLEEAWRLGEQLLPRVREALAAAQQPAQKNSAEQKA